MSRVFDMKYRINYIDNDRYFEGEKTLTVEAETEIEAINQLIQSDNRNAWQIISVETIAG
tara:strand:- start:338 stop:517 length:180 start_codon:yes stop_codon:yes gene_type:complete